MRACGAWFHPNHCSMGRCLTSCSTFYSDNLCYIIYIISVRVLGDLFFLSWNLLKGSTIRFPLSLLKNFLCPVLSFEDCYLKLAGSKLKVGSFGCWEWIFKENRYLWRGMIYNSGTGNSYGSVAKAISICSSIWNWTVSGRLVSSFAISGIFSSDKLCTYLLWLWLPPPLFM